MDLTSEVSLLAQAPMFREVEAARLKLMAFASQRLRFDEGDVLFSQGDEADAAYMLVEGGADVLVEGVAGPLLAARIGPGSILGEMAVLCNARRSATVVARGQVVALRIPAEVFCRMLRENPDMALAVMRDLAARLERTTSQLAGHARP
jgi:CRP-like cAMP-binding protein